MAGVPVISPFAYVRPSGKPVTSTGLSSRNPRPPSLSTTFTGIGVIGSFLVTVAPSAVIVGPVTSFTVTGTSTVSLDPSGYVTVTTAFPTLPVVAVDGLLVTVSIPGAKSFTLAFTSSSVIS